MPNGVWVRWGARERKRAWPACWRMIWMKTGSCAICPTQNLERWFVFKAVTQTGSPHRCWEWTNMLQTACGRVHIPRSTWLRNVKQCQMSHLESLYSQREWVAAEQSELCLVMFAYMGEHMERAFLSSLNELTWWTDMSRILISAKQRVDNAANILGARRWNICV